MTGYQWPVAYHTMPSRHDTSTQCRFSAGPPSPVLAINHSTLDSAFCWRWCVHRLQANIGPMFVKLWASVAGVGQYPFNSIYSQYFMLAEVLHIVYTAPMPFKCWPASYTMARHLTNLRYTDTLLGQWWACVA